MVVRQRRRGGGTRRYSADDLARLQRISALVDAGI
ncbi:MerR family transcriptional regulator, partial [Mycobacterium kansasii]